MLSLKKQTYKTRILISIFLTVTNYEVTAGNCRVAVTKCEVQDMITQALLAPQPGNASLASSAVTLKIGAVSNFQPALLNGPTNYSGSATLTLTAYNGTAAAASISCASGTASLSYYGYSGLLITGATNGVLTPTPAGAATAPALSIASASSGTTSSVSATTTAVTSFTPSNLWNVSLIGQYLCVITPTDTNYNSYGISFS